MADRRHVLAMGAASLAVGTAGQAMTSATDAMLRKAGRGLPFGGQWRFHRGVAEGAEAIAFDDAAWRRLDLPHDWSIEDLPDQQPPTRIGPFDQDAVAGTATGFTVGGEGWYRKHFNAAGLPAEHRVEILFEGVAVTCDVWVNGQSLGDHVHAYTPFAFDLTPHLRRDADNVVAVRVRNLGKNSRWYAGSGLYRPVTIDIVPQVDRIARWGIAAWTRRIEDGAAEIDVTTSLVAPTLGSRLRSRLLDDRGRTVAQTTTAALAETRQVLRVPAPRLWSPEAPNLYRLVVEVVRDGRVIDGLAQEYGIRIITMDARTGLHINGEHHVLRGGCVHHDNGILGAAAYPDADERRVLALRRRGFNAVRSGHNPSSASFRAACDRHGMLLIEEAFDAWHVHKRADDYAKDFPTHWRDDLGAMILAARNNPSVMMWSIGNEVPERATPQGVEWCWRLANEARRLDPSRPVTAGLQEFLGRPLVADAPTARPGMAGREDEASTIFLDVAGYNYRLKSVEADHARRPDRVMYASETFPREAFDYRALVERAPYFMGEFVWSAMDYIGEAGIGLPVRVAADAPPFIPTNYPVMNAFCGDIDLIGNQKPQSLARDVIWGISDLELVVQRPLPPGTVERLPEWGWSDELPCWTWPTATGHPLSVRLYTSGDRIVIRLNGTQVAMRTLDAGDRMRAEFAIPYAPGTLEAIAFRGGREIARRSLTTTGGVAAMGLRVEPAGDRLDRPDLLYVGVDLRDAVGRTVLDDDREVVANVSGPARIVGFGSGGPRAIGSMQGPSTQTFHGRALVILRRTVGAGRIRVEMRSSGLPGVAAMIPAN